MRSLRRSDTRPVPFLRISDVIIVTFAPAMSPFKTSSCVWIPVVIPKSTGTLP